jgi:hypothetical protein
MSAKQQNHQTKKQLLQKAQIMSFLGYATAQMDRAFDIFRKKIVFENTVIGHGDFRYKVHLNWGTPNDPSQFPIKDCHEMVLDSDGRLIMITNHPKNNVIIYSKEGKIVQSWTLGFKTAHGLSINNENGTDYLYICDHDTETVVKTTLNGQVIMKLPTPREIGIYENPNNYFPTETTIAANGDIYVSDGYGSGYIIQFDRFGNYIRHFGGRGKGNENLNTAHGLTIDNRGTEPLLIATSREDACFKYFTLSGTYISTVSLPGTFICRPVIHGDNLYAGACWSGIMFFPNTGFVTILDKNNKVVSNPGGNKPEYINNKLKKQKQAIRVFKHCHDVCIDNAGNIYVCQWNAGGLYPIKLERI